MNRTHDIEATLYNCYNQHTSKEEKKLKEKPTFRSQKIQLEQKTKRTVQFAHHPIGTSILQSDWPFSHLPCLYFLYDFRDEQSAPPGSSELAYSNTPHKTGLPHEWIISQNKDQTQGNTSQVLMVRYATRLGKGME